MELAYLKIQVEDEGEAKDDNVKFSTSPAEDHVIVTKFNPNRLSVSRTVEWQNQPVAKRDCPETQHTGATPNTLTFELFFDTYDNPEKKKKSVREETEKLYVLTVVDGKKHRPPVCRLSWGTMHTFFQGVLQQLALQYTLFMDDGTPVRATANCTFKQWQSNNEDLKKQKLMSNDVAKVWVVKSGETLAVIATSEYGDPRKWRPIAQANGIDDPMNLHPGSILVLPALSGT